MGPAMVLAICASLVTAVALAVAAPRDPVERQKCGAGDNRIAAEFALDHAADLPNHLPNMLRTPELEQDRRPAHVILFSGEFRTDLVAMAPTIEKPPLLNAVVCVIQADGTVNLYSDVSRAGSQWANE